MPCTPGGILAKRMRQGEEEMRGPTGYVVKIVEKAGDKIIDQLHKTNSWRGEDCTRVGCLHCLTKIKTGKYKTQCCKKRNLIYETWCRSCEEKEVEEIKAITDDDKERKEKISKMKLHKYIGESSRSIFERGFEHQNDKEQLSSKSHMLKHCIEQHREKKAEDIEFGIRVVSFCRTPFERQILESVKIQEARDHYILNSKSEYNRCALPRLANKIGENDYKKWEENQTDEKQKEKDIKNEIRNMRMRRNKERQAEPPRNTQPATKKRKVGANNYYFKVYQEKVHEKEKRKLEEAEKPGENMRR